MIGNEHLGRLLAGRGHVLGTGDQTFHLLEPNPTGVRIGLLWLSSTSSSPLPVK